MVTAAMQTVMASKSAVGMELAVYLFIISTAPNGSNACFRDVPHPAHVLDIHAAMFPFLRYPAISTTWAQSDKFVIPGNVFSYLCDKAVRASPGGEPRWHHSHSCV